MKYISFAIAACALFSCSQQQTQRVVQRTQHRSVKVITDDGFSKYVNKVTTPPPVETKKNQPEKEDPIPLEMTPTQTFSIKTNRDTTLVCDAGTKIHIPSYSMVYENTGEPVTGSVVLRVNEFYSKKDIFLAQLTTSSNGKMLESGGMVYVEASSASKRCALKTGKNVEVSFPYKKKRPDMQTFYGTRNENGMEWSTTPNRVLEEPNDVIADIDADEIQHDAEEVVMPEVTEVKENETYDWTEIQIIPEFPGGNTALNQFLQKNLRYPEMAREAGISGKVYVQFTIDKDGKVTDVLIKRGVETSLDKEALRVIKMLPAFIPGRVNGKNVRCRMIQPIAFRIAGSDYSPVNPNYKTIIEDKKTDSVEKEDINYYMLTSAQLGWINCDRFYSIENKAVLAVKESNPDVMVGMVFHSIRSYLRSTRENGNYVFKNIPANENITLLFCKKERGKNYISSVQTTTSAGSVIPVYREVTLEELKKEIEKLNNIDPTAVSMSL